MNSDNNNAIVVTSTGTYYESDSKPQRALESAMVDFEAAQYRAAAKMLEDIPSFAQDNDEGKWSIIGIDGESGYSEVDQAEMRNQARKMYFQSPDARNVIETMVNYIIGKNATFDAQDEDPIVQEYWDNWVEHNKWDLRTKEFIRRVLRDGEVFLRKFISNNQIKVRFINPSEIKNPFAGGGPFSHLNHTYGIECDPDDIETPLNYYRCYRVGEVDKWEQIPANEIIHVKIMVDSDVKRGISFLVGIAKYIKEYELWLKDRIQLNKIRHLFNVVGEPTGMSSPTDIKAQFDDTSGKTPTGGTPNKKLFKPGTVLYSKGVKWRYEALNINASDTKEDGRGIELMIAKGTQLPEYIVRGDASNANYASTHVSESPFVKAMESWQDFFEKPFKLLFKEVITVGIEENDLPTTSLKTNITIDNNGEKTETQEKIPTRTTCVINFATLIHRDIFEETKSYALQRNMNPAVVSSRTISGRLGYDYDDEQEQVRLEDKENEDKARADAGIDDNDVDDNDE